MAETNTSNGSKKIKKKKKKSITETFSIKTLKQGFDDFSGDLATALRGKNRGTRGLDK